MKKCLVKFEEVISLENLAEAWQEFVRGKRGKRDVQEYALRLADNLVELHEELLSDNYRHGGYREFTVHDPKLRTIHKASVRDRLLHHAVHRKVYPYFAKRFIVDSYSCQTGKGLHKAIDTFRTYANAVSKNQTRICWVLKCDIRKFFASIDQGVLLDMLKLAIGDRKLYQLLEAVIGSFSVTAGSGIPLGNLTSQLFANVFMDRFDQFVKTDLEWRYFVRYADDFVFLSPSKNDLELLLPVIRGYLRDQLRLDLHPHKVTLKKLVSGIDFLGWVHFPHHRIPRTGTRRRMLRRIQESPTNPTLQSYLGLLKHGNTYRLQQEIQNIVHL